MYSNSLLSQSGIATLSMVVVCHTLLTLADKEITKCSTKKTHFVLHFCVAAREACTLDCN